MKNIYLAILMLSLGSCKTEHQVSEIAIPIVSNIIIDGNAVDWENQAYAFSLRADKFNQSTTKNDFEVNLKLGWNDRGLLFLIEVQDDTINTHSKYGWQGDGIEIFLRDSIGGNNLIQYAFTALPTNDESMGMVHLNFREDEKLRKGEIRYEVKRSKTKSGYLCEGLIELDALNVIPEKNSSLACQINVNDLDTAKKIEHQYTWHYSDAVLYNSIAMQKIVLSNEHKASKAEGFVRAYVLDSNVLNIFYYPNRIEPNALFDISQNGKMLASSRAIDSAGCYRSIISIDSVDVNKRMQLSVNNKPLAELKPELFDYKYERLPKPQPFEKDICLFERKDQKNPPPANATLVIGSSSIRMWTNIHNDLKGHEIIHRGFGGSKAKDALRVVHRIVLPYKPARIVYYEGDNDIASGISPQEFIDTTKKFISIVHKELPNTKIYLLSVKPSISRLHLWPIVQEANTMLSELAQTSKNVYFIDVASGMFENDTLRADIFVSDGVHMNQKGYDIWTKIIRESLDK